MATEYTTNYNLKKPGTEEFYDVGVQNENMEILDAALTPEADPDEIPTGNVGKLVQWVSWLTNRIKAIVGGTNWYDTPPISLTEAANSISSHTGNKDNPHGVTKSQVGLGNVTNDAQMPIAGGTFTGVAKAQINTSYTTLQLRNISLYADGVTVPTLGNGEIVFTYK